MLEQRKRRGTNQVLQELKGYQGTFFSRGYMLLLLTTATTTTTYTTTTTAYAYAYAYSANASARDPAGLASGTNTRRGGLAISVASVSVG